MLHASGGFGGLTHVAHAAVGQSLYTCVPMSVESCQMPSVLFMQPCSLMELQIGVLPSDFTVGGVTYRLVGLLANASILTKLESCCASCADQKEPIEHGSQSEFEYLLRSLVPCHICMMRRTCDGSSKQHCQSSIASKHFVVIHVDCKQQAWP